MSQFSNSSASILLYFICLCRKQLRRYIDNRSNLVSFFLKQCQQNSTGVSSPCVQIKAAENRMLVVLIAGKFYYYTSAVMGLLRAHTHEESG
jgi:hypothetical protein